MAAISKSLAGRGGCVSVVGDLGSGTPVDLRTASRNGGGDRSAAVPANGEFVASGRQALFRVFRTAGFSGSAVLCPPSGAVRATAAGGLQRAAEGRSRSLFASAAGVEPV